VKNFFYFSFLLLVIGCGSGPKKNGVALATSEEALLAVQGCGNTAECAVVVTAAVTVIKAAKIINGEPAPLPQVKDAKKGQLVIKCYMKDEEAGFLYPCGTYQVFYKNKKLNDYKQLRSRGETTEIPRFPELGDIKVQIDTCNKSQELKEVKAGSVVHVQFSNVCKS